MLRRGLRRFVLGAPASGSSSLAGGCTSTVCSRSNASCSAQMIAERSDRAPKIRPFNVAICARRSSFSPSKASTISARAAGSEGRSSGRIAMSENYTKTLVIASKTGRFSRRSSAASSPWGPLATTPRDLRSASPIEPPSRASSPREQVARRSRRPQAIWSPEPDPSHRTRAASNDPIASSEKRKRRRCRARRPDPPPRARPDHARLFGSRSAASPQTPGHPGRRRSPRRPHRRQYALQRHGVDADRHAHRRAGDHHLDPFGRTRQNAWLIDRVRPRLGAVVEPDLHERRPFDGSEPRLAPPHIEQSPADPVAPRHLGNVHFRIGALGQDPRLLRIAPIAPTPQPRYHLDALIRVGIMLGLMHGISAPRMSKSKCESRSAERHKRGGAAVPVTIVPRSTEGGPSRFLSAELAEKASLVIVRQLEVGPPRPRRATLEVICQCLEARRPITTG